MALFGFADIEFNKNTSERSGSPLGKLTNNSGFETTTLRYPSDLGNYDKAHYIIFYVRKQNSTKYTGMTDASSGTTSTGSIPSGIPAIPTPEKLGNELLTKLNSGLSSLNSMTNGALSGVTGQISKAATSVVGNISNLFGGASMLKGDSQQTKFTIENSVKQVTGGSLSFLRTTTLTTDAIALYMPDTLAYTHSQSYDQLAIGGELLGQISAAGQSAIDAYQRGDMKGALAAVAKSAAMNVGQRATEAVGNLAGSPNSAQLGAAKLLGAVKNPMLEMIYRSPNFRSFTFDFMFYPRSEREAYEVQRIIERFRFHQAPEFEKNTMGFLVPPSEFDIGLYYAGNSNPNLPTITTCVLTNMDVNYAPNGFSAYEVPGIDAPFLGGTGMPVAIQLTLNFQEVSYLTKEDYNEKLAIGKR